ncbi:MAG: amino acid ABC transporter permease [Candidatus Limnocylindrales bacterium]
MRGVTRHRGSPTTTLRPALGLAGASLVAVLLAGCTASSQPGSYQFHWNYFVDSIIHPDHLILGGLVLTVSISIISQVIGVILGIFAAISKLSRVRAFRWIANVYIWIFRGTPLVVQLVFFYFGLSVTKIYNWPDLTIGPLTIQGAVQAGIFTLGLNEGAYMAEIVRAGILAIDPGQSEAAKALGMTAGQTMRRIVLPQAARVIVPPLGNEFNNMLKTTSLLFVLSVQELYTVFNIKQGNDFAPFEYFLAAAVWFLILTTIWGVIQARIEKRLAVGTGSSGNAGPQPGLISRMIGLRNNAGNRIAGSH